jgi:hypothetical protein
MAIKKTLVRPGPEIIEMVPETREVQKASYLALLAMTRLFLDRETALPSSLPPRFIQVMEEFIARGFSDHDEIRPHLRRIEAFLSASI